MSEYEKSIYSQFEILNDKLEEVHKLAVALVDLIDTGRDDEVTYGLYVSAIYAHESAICDFVLYLHDRRTFSVNPATDSVTDE